MTDEEQRAIDEWIRSGGAAAALKELQGEEAEWTVPQPPDTAPRDESWFLACVPGNDAAWGPWDLIYWNPGRGEFDDHSSFEEPEFTAWCVVPEVGWRPKSTAPDDGTWFLTRTPAEVYAYSRQPYGMAYWDSDAGEFREQDVSDEAEFDEWRPLPGGIEEVEG